MKVRQNDLFIFNSSLLIALLGLGAYYETNDDQVITYLLQGRMAAAPVTNLYLYFHGLAGGLVWLYQTAPGVPWYGLLLYGLLYLATLLTFAVLRGALRPWLRPGAVAGLLGAFFLLAWVEHGLWFSYVRVPLLLAPAGLLFAAQRPGRRGVLAVGLLAFAVAWLIRPSAAVLGGALAGPGAWWLSGRRSRGVLAGAALLAGVGGLGVSLTRPPAAATYRRLDVRKSTLNDYQLARPAPRSAPDRLGLQAAQSWLFLDATLVNTALLRRAAPLDAGYFLRRVAPGKAAALLRLLARDYFPLLALLALSAWQVARAPGAAPRRGFWLAQAAYLAGLLGLGLGLKLPPRLALPYLDYWLISNGLFVLSQGRPVPRLTRAGTGLLLVLLGLYGYKTFHRRQVLLAERRANAAQLRRLGTTTAPLLVSGGMEEYYKSASPFGNDWDLPPRLLALAGWNSLDPSQPAFLAALTGTRDLSAALRRLAGRGGRVRWVLTPAVAAVLNQQLARTRPAGAPRVRLRPADPAPPAGAGTAPRVYVADVDEVDPARKAKIL